MNPKISLEEKLDKQAPAVFIMPAVLIVLFFSIFPLIVSLFIALSRLKFIKGGVQLKFIGWLNFKKLLFGSQQYHFLGKFDQLTPVGFFLLGLFVLAVFHPPSPPESRGSPPLQISRRRHSTGLRRCRANRGGRAPLRNGGSVTHV